MTAREIIKNFIGDNSRAPISEKQRTWLLAQCRTEKLTVKDDGHGEKYIYFSNCYFHISHCTRFASAGSYGVKVVVPGRYMLKKYFRIKFTDTGIEDVYDLHALEDLKKTDHQFEIINPLTK